MHTAIMLLVLGFVGPQDIATDRVDLVEINHFFDEQGRLVFDQIIFYEWSAIESRFHVRAWRLIKSPTQIPRRNWQTGFFTTIWYDGDILREIHSILVHETWTQYDPELLEREFLPKDKRHDLNDLNNLNRQIKSDFNRVMTTP
jgi:hypothetical protein